MRTYFIFMAVCLATMAVFSACDNTGKINPIVPELGPTALLSGLGECEDQREPAEAPQGDPETPSSGSPAGAERLDRLEATVGADGTVSFTHTGALFNCCLDSVTLDVEVLGNVIRVAEIEHCANPCFCTCERTVYGEIKGLDPGSYTIEISGTMESAEPYCSAVVTIY